MDKKTIDTTVTSGSRNLITSGAVYTAINVASNKLEGSISWDCIGYKSGISYTHVAQTAYNGYSYGISQTSIPGNVTVRFKKEKDASAIGYGSTNSGTSMAYPPKFVNFVSNLKGSGTITITINSASGGLSSNTTQYLYLSEIGLPKIKITVEKGVIIDTTFSFASMHGGSDLYIGSADVSIE